MTTATPTLRGWALMKKNNPDRFAELTRKGGASVSPEKRSFAANRELAREAGRRGGQVSRKTSRL